MDAVERETTNWRSVREGIGEEVFERGRSMRWMGRTMLREEKERLNSVEGVGTK